MKDDRLIRAILVAAVLAVIAAVAIGAYLHGRQCDENRGYGLEGCPN